MSQNPCAICSAKDHEVAAHIGSASHAWPRFHDESGQCVQYGKHRHYPDAGVIVWNRPEIEARPHRRSPPSLAADAGASYQRAMSNPKGSTSDNEGRIGTSITTPKTFSGISLFHHLVFPESYGWPTDEQLAAAIRKVEEEMPPTPDFRINRDGLFMSLGVAQGFLVLALALVVTVALMR